MKILPAITGLCLLSLFTQTVVAADGQGASPAPLFGQTITNHGPSIRFTDTLWEIGRVQAGKTLMRSYTFTNTGDQSLIIHGIGSSCGCTAATNWTRRVEPGEAGKIPVVFNSGDLSGPLAKNLWVLSNDPIASNVVLFITATVWKPIDALPSVAMFNFGPNSQTNETRILRLVSNVEEPIKIEEPVCTNGNFRVELKTVKEGKEYELHVSVIPPLPPGVSSASISLKTSASNMPLVTVSGYAMVQPPVAVTPPRLILPAGKLAKAQQFGFNIRNAGTNRLILSEPVFADSAGEATLEELQPGQVYKLLLALPAGFRIPAGKQFEVRIKTNHPLLPMVKVPILQLMDPDEPSEPDKTPAAAAASAGSS